MKRRRLLLITALVFLLAAAGLFVGHYLSRQDHRAITLEELQGLQPATGTYRSINNWATIENTDFRGVPLYRFLEEYGVRDPGAEIKLIAPDGYFWPAVNTTLTLKSLRQASPDGLYSLLAWEMDGATLEAEPGGSGPLRLVMPQYDETDVNKPSWVSNVRLVEVGPLKAGATPPDAATVPIDEVWLYGNVTVNNLIPIWWPILLLIAAALLLAEYLFYRRMGRRVGPEAPAALLLVLTLVLAGLVAPPAAGTAAAAAAPVIYSGAELAGMPQTSAHYTFLKSQEPYTYYEEDYAGVSLNYLLGGALSLHPGAAEIVVRARDGYAVALSLSEARGTFPGGLQSIIATSKAGAPLAGEEGRLRLIVPQSVPGTRDAGGQPNTPDCARKVYAIEVRPLPAGVATVSPGQVPDGSLAVYGAISLPAPPVEPQPEPTPADPTDPVAATTPPAAAAPVTAAPSLQIDAGILASPLCTLFYELALVRAPSIWLDPMSVWLWSLERSR